MRTSPAPVESPKVPVAAIVAAIVIVGLAAVPAYTALDHAWPPE